VLVTDGEQRSALAIVRSLGRAGHRVHVLSRSGQSLAGASRYATSDERCPDALAQPDAFAGAVRKCVAALGVDVVIPVTEAALLAVLPNRDALGATVPFASASAFAAISDKHAVLDAAARSGIAIPEQVVLATAGDAANADTEALRYPVVLKPARSVAGESEARVKLSVMHADSPAAFRAAIAGLPVAAFPLLVQQRVVGPGIGIFVLLWDGTLRAAFAHRRIREKPPSGGVSVYRESVALDPGLLERSVALLDAFSWRGVAMVEYKVDAATGTPYLMEINGRFWGSLQLAIDAGVDFPTLLLRAADGEQFAPVMSYNRGVRSRWWWGDVDHLIARLRHSDAELALPPGSAGRVKTLAAFVRGDPRDRDEIAQAGDRRPFLRESWQWVRALAGGT